VRFAITGSTGLVGNALRKRLATEGHEVTRVVRSFGGVGPGEKVVIWHPSDGTIEAAGLEGHDVVVHLAGEPIAGVWTEGRKRRILDSRKQGTSLLAKTLASLERPPALLLSASGMNFYGDRPSSQPLTESSPPGTGFLADVVREWENATEPAEVAGIRVVHMRSANVLSPNGGVLGTVLPIFRLGLGARFGDGDQVWSWIAIDDSIGAMLFLTTKPEISGPVNFAAPNPVTNEEFTKAIAAAVGRPAILRIPSFAARLAPGGMADEILLASTRVAPEKLLEAGYDFRHPDLRPALKAMLARDGGGSGPS
jgi:uncharacterized protein (TIGR01777 family)